jgi:hypothetical protein
MRASQGLRPAARTCPYADTLAGLEAETWGAFLMTFLLVELNGRAERNEIDDQQRSLPPLTPLTSWSREAGGVRREEALGLRWSRVIRT